MSTLVTAVEAGSFSAASRKLGMPLPTVSRKVAELEAHIGTRLVKRTSRRLALTDAGRSYIEACRKILEDIEEAERLAAGEYRAPRGELRITAPIVFGRVHVLPVVTEFLKEYPEIDVQLRLADWIVNLIEEHIDVAVRIGELADSALVARKVGATRPVVCGSPGYFTRKGLPQEPADLADHDCINFEGLSSRQAWSFQDPNGTLAVSIHSRLSVNTAEAAIDAAVAGAGMTRVLSYQIIEELRAGALRTVLQDFEPAAMPVNLVYAGGRLLPQKLRAFLDFAVSRLGARL